MAQAKKNITEDTVPTKRVKDMTPEERRAYNKHRAEVREKQREAERLAEEAEKQKRKERFDKDRELVWLRLWFKATKLHHIYEHEKYPVVYNNEDYFDNFEVDFKKETLSAGWGYGTTKQVSIESLTEETADELESGFDSMLSQYRLHLEEQAREEQERRRQEELRKTALAKVGNVLSPEEAAALGLKI